MNRETDKESNIPQDSSRWSKHRLLFMVLGAIVLVVFVTSINLELYRQNGAELDASSLPAAGRKKISQDVQESIDQSQTFSATGKINQDVFEEFNKKFTYQRKKTGDINAFGGNVLEDSSLGLPEKHGE